MAKRPSMIDIQTMLIQRRDLATEKVAKYQSTGQLGYEVYWRTIQIDAEMLAAYIAADDYWQIMAKQKAGELERCIAQLENAGKPKLAAGKHTQNGPLCGGNDNGDCPACERDMALARSVHA